LSTKSKTYTPERFEVIVSGSQVKLTSSEVAIALLNS